MLIDKDALIYDIEMAPLTGDGGVDINDLEEIIKRQPTIEERKTGRWIPQDHNHKYGNLSTCAYFYPICSECGHTGDFGMKFCPECGVRMTEVEHEAD